MASQSKRQVCREIQDTLAAALAARGVTARLTLTDQCATLKADERSAEVALADLPHVWPQLPRGERSKRIGHLVRQLTSRWDQGRTSLWWTTVVPLFVIAAVTLGLGIPLVRGAVPKETLGPRPVSTSIVQRATHAAGVCETTRSRVMRGATAGVADHEGWLVELSLVTAASDVLPPTGEFFSPLPSDHLAVSWNGSPELGKITDGHVELVERRSNSKRETKFVLHGGYVRSYFAESERAEWQRFGNVTCKTRRSAVRWLVRTLRSSNVAPHRQLVRRAKRRSRRRRARVLRCRVFRSARAGVGFSPSARRERAARRDATHDSTCFTVGHRGTGRRGHTGTAGGVVEQRRRSGQSPRRAHHVAVSVSGLEPRCPFEHSRRSPTRDRQRSLK